MPFHKLGLLVFFAAQAAFGIGPATFSTAFYTHLNGKLPLSIREMQNGSQYGYIFVKGFINEIMPNYFEENTAELKRLGVPAINIQIIEPGSGRDFTENVTALNNAFNRNVKRGLQTVFVAHSRGAVDVLRWALLNASFVTDKIKALFLIQGAYWGSGVADDVAPIIGSTLLDYWLHTGVASLSHVESAKVMHFLLSLPLQNREELSQKVFYITGSKAPCNVTALLTPSAHYLSTYYGINDGLVETKEQIVQGLGNVILHGNFDHLDLTNGYPVNGTSSRYREALTRAIVYTVAQ